MNETEILEHNEKLLNTKLIDFNSNKIRDIDNDYKSIISIQLSKYPEIHKLIINYLQEKLPYNIIINIDNDYNISNSYFNRRLPVDCNSQHLTLNNQGLFKTLQQHLDDLILQLQDNIKISNEQYITILLDKFQFYYQIDNNTIPPQIMYSEWQTYFKMIT